MKNGSTLDECLIGRTKSHSPLVAISKTLYPNDYDSKAKSLLKRISSKKFLKCWNSLNRIPTPQNSESTSLNSLSDLNLNSLPKSTKRSAPHDETLSSDHGAKSIKVDDDPEKMHIGDFVAEKSKFFDNENRIKSVGREWTQNLYSIVPCSLVPCLISVKNYNFNGVNLTIYADCKSKKCSVKHVFKSVIGTDQKIKIDVFREGEFHHSNHEEKLSRNISGKLRENITDQVIELGAYKTQNQIIFSKDLSSANHRNEEVKKTLNSLRQMKHQRLAFSDFDSNDLTDILCLKELTDNMPSESHDVTPSYIRYIRADNFMVSWGCFSQMDAFMQNSSKVVSIDATGNVVKNVDGKIFYYSIVFKSKLSNDIIPLYQFLASKHDIPNITSCLAVFVRELKIFSGQERPISEIVIDFSFALMNSVCIAFNNCSLLIYLDILYRQCIQNMPPVCSLTYISSCSVHVIKFFTDKLKIFDRPSKKTLQLNFAKCIESSTYAEFLSCFSKLYIALNHEKISLDVLSHLSDTSGIALNTINLIDSIEETTVEVVDLSDFQPKGSKYMSSPFVSDIEISVKELLEKDRSNYINNPFYNSEVAKYLLRRLGPFSSLWSSYIHSRGTNAIVEAHNKLVKHHILQSANSKPGRAIKEL